MKHIFEKFKLMLGLRAVDWTRPVNIYLTPYEIPLDGYDPLKQENRKWPEVISEFKLLKIGQMHNPTMESINNITGMESEASYEEIEYLPASAVIFSQQCPAKCYVKNDYEYSQYGYDPWVVHDSIRDNTNADYFNSNYWELNYGFAPEFSQAEYDSYNLKTTPLTENVIKLNAGNNSISAASDINSAAKDSHMCGYGILVDILHKDALPNDDRGSMHIPVAYIPFDRFHDAKNGTMNIVWNSNGFLRLE